MNVELNNENDINHIKIHVKININKSNVFNENRHELKIWLIQIKLYFKFNKIANVEKIFFATIYFRKRTKHWIQSMIKKYLNENSKTTIIFVLFFKFEIEFRRIFDVSNEKQTAEQIIQHLIQKISTSNYVAKFQKYLHLTKWNNATFMIMFQQNFKNNVKNEMMRDERFIENFKITIKMTIDLNDKLYERTLKKRYFKRRQKCDENYINHRTYKKKRHHAIKNIWKKRYLWN